MTNTTFSIATSKAHLRAPFTFAAINQKPGDKQLLQKLTTKQKVITCAIAIFALIPGFLIGGVIAFYLVSASFKARQIKLLQNVKPISLPQSQATESSSNEASPSPVNPIITTPPPLAESDRDHVLPITPRTSTERLMAGLPNYTGNICWLNSVVKFFATTKLFDDVLQTDVKGNSKLLPNEKMCLEKLQNELNSVIQSLRKESSCSVLNRSDYEKMVQAVADVMPGLQVGRVQLESRELIALLLSKLDTLNNDDISALDQSRRFQLMTEYNGVGHLDKKSSLLHPFHFSLMITPSQNQLKIKTGAINLQESVSLEEEVEVRGDVGPQDRLFTKKNHFVHLPENLVVDMGRLAIDLETGDRVKCGLPIQVDENNQVTFTEYHPDGTEKNICHYRFEAATIHVGSASGGHYVFSERRADGKFVIHNDSSVSVISEQEFLKGKYSVLTSGTVLRLKLVSRTPC